MYRAIIILLLVTLPISLAASTTDPLVSEQWYLYAIHDFNTNIPSHTKPIIAIIDTGVDADLGYDLTSNVWNVNGLHGFNTIPFAGPLDCATESYFEHSICPFPPQYLLDSTDVSGHGTHVAGICCAAKDGIGIQGVSDATVMPVKALQSSSGEWNNEGSVIAGIIIATDAGANVISMSIGIQPGNFDSTALCNATSYALSHGVVVVAAAGNENQNQTDYPAACDGVIAVGSVNETLQPMYLGHYFGTNYGTRVDIVAPGVNILSDQSRWYTSFGYYYRGAGWLNMTGTSMATPIVSGVAAEVIETNPTLTNIQVRNILLSSVDNISLNTNSSNGTYFNSNVGLINASLAIENAKS